MPGGSTVSSAGRANNPIEPVASSEGGLALAELSRRSGVPKSGLHGLVHTLRRRGDVGRDGTMRTFHLGLRVREVARAFDLHDEFVRVALPSMQAIVREMNERAQRAERDGIHNVYPANVDCEQPIQLISRVGARLHGHATGLGKALLPGMSDDAPDRRSAGVPLPRFTSAAITDLPALKRESRRVRAMGYAEDREEYVCGLRRVAVPLRSATGQVRAARSVSLPALRATEEEGATGLRLLLATAGEFLRRLPASAGERPDDGPGPRPSTGQKGGERSARARGAALAGPA